MPASRKNVLEGLRILVVEDDFLIAMDLETTLNELGCDVVGPYESLEKALAGLDTRIDGAVVDLNLRGKYSFPLIERLRELEIPLIVCSGYVDLPDIKARLNGIPSLPKPCAQDRLVEMMDRVFTRAQSGSQAEKRMSQTSPLR